MSLTGAAATGRRRACEAHWPKQAAACPIGYGTCLFGGAVRAPFSSRAPSFRRPCPNSGGDVSRPSSRVIGAPVATYSH
eukprot:4752538-Prymnesium_polylepis.1